MLKNQLSSYSCGAYLKDRAGCSQDGEDGEGDEPDRYGH